MKLTTMTQVTVDGVVQGNGGASDEDRRNGFERGGWAKGAGDDETRALITRTCQRADAFLFGRRTYELFAGSRGAIEAMRAHPIGAALDKAPKYVASATLTEPRWADTAVLSGDLAAAIGELKARPGGELQVLGNGLVDEITLLIVPVVLGQGTRLFPAAGTPGTRGTSPACGPPRPRAPWVRRSSSPRRGRGRNRKAGVRRNAASDDPTALTQVGLGVGRRAFQPKLGVRQSSPTLSASAQVRRLLAPLALRVVSCHP
jgi:dihydrofolate reductase